VAADASGGRPRFLAALLLLALAVLIAAPPLLPKYFLDVLISVLFTAYLGASWNILGGYAG
jgi:ABC-type branched-subunit amino acid transport system permease subunit